MIVNDDRGIMSEDTPLIPETRGNTRGVLRQIGAVAAACLGALSLGLVLGYSSPALPDLKAKGVLNDLQGTWYGSLVTLGAMVGGPFGGFLADSVGRKTSIIICAIPFTSGWLINILTTSVSLLYIGRLLTGLATGMASLCVPIYIAEVSAANLRGRFGTCFQVSTTTGILLVYTLGLGVLDPWLSVSCALVPAAMAVFILLVPETPRWLLRHGRKQEAIHALSWLRCARSDREISREWVELDGGLATNSTEKRFSWQDMMRPAIYKPFFYSVMLMFFQQFSGINAIIFYTKDIFQAAGFNGNPGIPTVIIGALQVGVTIFSSTIVDRAGRKIMLIISGIFMTVSCVAFGLYHYMDSSSLNWLSLTSLALYISAFSIGWGPLPWVVMSELLPPKGYGITSGFATATNWCIAFIVTKEFAAMEATLTKYGTFWMFGTICALGAAFVALFIPETKGKSLQDIVMSFESWWTLKFIINQKFSM